jgi:dihydropteroate synthase
MDEQRAIEAPGSLTIGSRHFDWGSRTYVMGAINVTPDSFSGDGLGLDLKAAIAQGLRFVQEGADILDVGGESTRPGFQNVPAEEEMRRVLPVVKRLAREVDVPISIDTYRAAVARAALEAGAHLVNDIWGFRHDPAMAPLTAEFGVPAVIMHNQRGRSSRDVIGGIRAGVKASLRLAERVGIPRQRLIIDPGFGFGWEQEHNLEMLRRLEELRDMGMPILIGTSRKSTIGAALGGVPVEERLMGTAATVAIAVAHGADIVRVHDVAEMAQVCRMTDAIVRVPPRGGRAHRK